MSDPFENRITTGLIHAGLAHPEESGASAALQDLILDPEWKVDIERTLALAAHLSFCYPKRDMRFLTGWLRLAMQLGRPEETRDAILQLAHTASIIDPGQIVVLSRMLAVVGLEGRNSQERTTTLRSLITLAVNAASPVVVDGARADFIQRLKNALSQRYLSGTAFKTLFGEAVEVLEQQQAKIDRHNALLNDLRHLDWWDGVKVEQILAKHGFGEGLR